MPTLPTALSTIVAQLAAGNLKAATPAEIRSLLGQQIIQHVYTGYNALATGTTGFPVDDTIPQNTEGNEFMTRAITPGSTSNILVISGQVQMDVATAGGLGIAAIFQDSTANALWATSSFMNTASGLTLPFLHIMAAGTTSETTFKVRAGVNSTNTVYFNGNSSLATRVFGDIPKSYIQIHELAA